MIKVDLSHAKLNEDLLNCKDYKQKVDAISKLKVASLAAVPFLETSFN